MKRGKFWISSMLGIGTASAILASEYLLSLPLSELIMFLKHQQINKNMQRVIGIM